MSEIRKSARVLGRVNTALRKSLLLLTHRADKSQLRPHSSVLRPPPYHEMAPQIYAVPAADIDSDSELHSPRPRDHDDDDDDEDTICPVLDSAFRLSPDGEFAHYIQRMDSSLLSETHDSHHRESTVMDQRKTIRYMNIGAREKRSVFQLPAVRRSMRLLNYGELLMSPEILEISLKCK